jgi:galactokinase
MYFRQYIIEQEMQHEEPPATSLQMQVQRMSLGIVNTNNETRLRMDEIEERLDEIAKAIDGLTTNMNYMAAKRGINLLNVSGYPRTHE